MRAAYRGLARRLHPDGLAGATDAERRLAERRMREINEAWQVLQDPAARRRYDDSLLGRRSTPRRPERPATPPDRVADDDADLVEVLPPMTAVRAALMRHLPATLVMGSLLVIFVVTAYASTDRSGDRAPEPAPIEAGACIDVLTEAKVQEVPCSGPHELEVVRLVRAPSDCPAGSSPRRFGSARRWECVEPGTKTTTSGG